MKGVYAFLSTCCLISCGLAKPASVVLGYQDSLGQYSFGYSAPGSARSEIRTSNGATHGAYSYIDGTGVIQSAQYVADGENGFRIVASNLPQAPLPVQDTEEVMAARAAHLQAVEIAKNAENSPADAESKIAVKSVLLQNLKPEEQASKSEEKMEESKEEKIEMKAKSAEPEKAENQEESKTIGEKENQEIPKETAEVTVSRASQEVTATGPPSAIPFITSHVVIPHLIQPSLPVFRVSHGNREIEPTSVKEQLNIPASSNTPAGTALESSEKSPEKIETKSSTVDEEQPKPQEKEAQVEPIKTIISPILPLNSYSGIIRYAPALHYITYNVL